MFRISSRGFTTALVVGLASRHAAAQEPQPAKTPPSPPVSYVTAGDVPTQLLDHIDAGTQQFPASVGGLRSYLESIRSSEPRLYLELDPHLSHLESKRTTATAILVGGLAVGAAAAIYGFVGTKDCSAHSVTDAGGIGFSQCNDDNFERTVAFTLIGAGSVTVGLVAWLVIKPGRSDLLDFVNERNRLSQGSLRWDVGYDAVHQFAYARAALGL